MGFHQGWEISLAKKVRRRTLASDRWITHYLLKPDRCKSSKNTDWSFSVSLNGPALAKFERLTKEGFYLTISKLYTIRLNGRKREE